MHVLAKHPMPPEFRAQFRIRKIVVTVTLPLSQQVALPDPHGYSARLESIVFTGEEMEEGPISEFLTTPSELAAFIRQCCDLVLLALRNFGDVPAAHPPLSVPDDKRRLAWMFDVEVRRDEEWTQLDSPFTLEDVLTQRAIWSSNPFDDVGGYLQADKWDDIREGIEAKTSPSPEDEFKVNALEHLEKGNLRMAIVETTICLEICVAKWMDEWFPTRGVSTKDVKSYLSRDLGIAARVATLLPVMVRDGQFPIDYDQAKVLKLINYRNAIAHKTGKLSHVPEDVLRECISEGITLAIRAAREAEILARRQTLNQIEAAIESTFGFKPQLRFFPPRMHFAAFKFEVGTDFPVESELVDAINMLSGLIRQWDPRFNPDDHLDAGVVQGRRLIAHWENGGLRWIGQPISVPPPPEIAPTQPDNK